MAKKDNTWALIEKVKNKKTNRILKTPKCNKAQTHD